MASVDFDRASALWPGTSFAPPRPKVRRTLPRYAVVSAVALALDFAIFAGLTHAGYGAALAGVVGYTFGLVCHFCLSSRFVFNERATTKSQSRLLAEFALSGVIGLIITTLTIGVCTGLFHLAPVAAKVVAVGISFAAVFAMRHIIVFATND